MLLLGWMWGYTQVEEVPSETPPLDKILNDKCHNNVEAKNKDGQNNKRHRGSRKEKYSSSSNESNCDRHKDSSEDSYIEDDLHCTKNDVFHWGCL